jgi:hypothetical protein
MPDFSQDLKSGRSPGISDLLSAMKRNTSIAVARSKDAGLNRKSLIKQQGFNTGFLDLNSKRGLDYYLAGKSAIIVSGTLNGGLIGSIKIIGYNLLGLTDADKNAFLNAFALQYGVNPNLITISFAAGSLIINISAKPILNVDGLTRRDKSFFANAESVIRGVQPINITGCVTSANISTSRLSVSGTIEVDVTYTSIDEDLDIINECKDDTEFQQNLTDLVNPMVGDPINDCMYSLINGSVNKIVVRINKNGSADRICDYPEAVSYRQIFINSDSTYLIIPSDNYDTLSPASAQPLLPRPNKVYLINILTGVISTITLTDLNVSSSSGFDKLSRRFYYLSYMDGPTKYLKLCYVTIPANYSSATLSATYYSNIGSTIGNIEFIDSNNAYAATTSTIRKLDLSVANGSSTIIAGAPASGAWSSPALGWNNGLVNGPYLDAPNGTNAFFSLIQCISYDSINNRLLIVDIGAKRIRSLDLTLGNNFAVTTLAGTSPTTLGLAINAGGTTYSQGVLNTLAQVGPWGSNSMPAYTKINGTYLSSTFQSPTDIIIFNNKMYVLTNLNATKQLSNGYVTDFLVSKNF